MNTLINLLKSNPQVSDWKINIHNKESYELFFVKGNLETLRCTDTCDKEVTVYVDHGEFKGDAQFFVYPSTTQEQMAERIEEAVAKALLIRNQAYTLPEGSSGEFAVESNFADYPARELAARIAKIVFGANTIENAALNSVEIFINRHTDRVLSSRNMDKTQVRYDAMVEAIPTYNGEEQSVELHEQYNFSSFDEAALRSEIAGKMAEVKARCEAAAPTQPLACPVVLNIQEVAQLMGSIARNLNYATVYSRANLFKKGDAIQGAPEGDKIGITMAGSVPGSIRSAAFDSDGMALGSVRLVEKGAALNYYGANRFGQYLQETPTGSLPCMAVDPGTAVMPDNYLEVVSMSGLQVDFFSDYIGGEVRLAYHHHDGEMTAVTGISISGHVSQVLNHIRFSPEAGTQGAYYGPKQALLQDVKIF